jgi:hypothetical protein
MAKKIRNVYKVILNIELRNKHAEISNTLLVNADEAEIWDDKDAVCSYIIFKQDGEETYRVQEGYVVAYGPVGSAKLN